jgi:hypothetical protein
VFLLFDLSCLLRLVCLSLKDCCSGCRSFSIVVFVCLNTDAWSDFFLVGDGPGTCCDGAV